MTHEELAALNNAREFVAGEYKPGSTLDVKYAVPMVSALLDMLSLRGAMAESIESDSDESGSPIPEPQPE